MASGAAGDDRDVLIAPCRLGGERRWFGSKRKGNKRSKSAGRRAQAFRNHFWLLKDFLEHEMLVALLLGLLEVPFDFFDVQRALFAVKREKLDSIFGHAGQLEVIHVDDALGVLDECGNIGSQEIFLFS